MRRPRLPAAVVAALAAVAVALAQEPAARPESPFLNVRKGNMPVIISAPHGGTGEIPGVPTRRGVGLPTGPNGFYTGRDPGTEELAATLAVEVFLKTGKRPYLVTARFSRRYVDANRPADVAYESPRAKPVYDAYHDTLAGFCKEVRKVHGRGLLLDVHNQATFPDSVVRGTQDGKTVALLRQRFGEKAHCGPDSLLGLLGGAGFKTHPAKLDGKEHDNFNGGYIVRTYSGDYGLDAVQLEFGWMLTTPVSAPETAGKVAAAIDQFHRLYLVDAK
ncbi:N-formylglutamate amidohydrolase [Urbifossiella limnaea]|uniref:N-formylglutamate amidohydrolase n=1 Tax=Urbifossiella limnaea TaxID=2528023 RepID=A0A517Y0K4_9BACT|nr:N-formylglutamate amidohydrolase [Urbifossiella limnaea]QDU23289.1 N-formylglutamate amidohydrolase [Urbifossiella limnaea]